MNPGDNVFKALKWLMAVAIVGAVATIGWVVYVAYLALN